MGPRRAGRGVVNRVVDREDQRAIGALGEIEVAGCERRSSEVVEDRRARRMHLGGGPQLGQRPFGSPCARERVRQSVMDQGALLGALVAVRRHLVAENDGGLVPLSGRLEHVGECRPKRRVGGVPGHGELQQRGSLRGLVELVPVKVRRLAEPSEPPLGMPRTPRLRREQACERPPRRVLAVERDQAIGDLLDALGLDARRERALEVRPRATAIAQRHARVGELQRAKAPDLGGRMAGEPLERLGRLRPRAALRMDPRERLERRQRAQGARAPVRRHGLLGVVLAFP